MHQRTCCICGMLCFIDWDGPDPTCYPCFKDGRGWKMTRADESLRELQECYTGAVAMLDVARKRPLPNRPPLDASRIEQLIRLCHPDRHGGREMANEVTAWLLSLRGAQ